MVTKKRRQSESLVQMSVCSRKGQKTLWLMCIFKRKRKEEALKSLTKSISQTLVSGHKESSDNDAFDIETTD